VAKRICPSQTLFYGLAAGGKITLKIKDF